MLHSKLSWALPNFVTDRGKNEQNREQTLSLGRYRMNKARDDGTRNNHTLEETLGGNSCAPICTIFLTCFLNYRS